MGRFWHVVAASSILGIGVLILTFAISDSDAANRDFVFYWAAGKQLIHHANPYDGPEMLALERSVGFSDSRPFFARNPPYALWVTVPIALFSARVGSILWLLALIGALMVSVRCIWRMNGSPPDRLHFAGYAFPPVLGCLFIEQVGLFLLLGVMLFLSLRERRPFAAGAALTLCALKPHLFIPFGAVLVCWIIAHRAYRLLAGFAAAMAAALAIAYVLYPGAWPAYFRMIHTVGIQNEFIPTLSLIFRLAIHRDWVWLQSVPAFAAAVWAVVYFQRRSWDWMENGMFVLLVSVMVAPYAWFTDEAVLMPAILFALYRASNQGRSLIPYLCIAGVALLELFARAEMNSGAYIWTTAAWLLWYAYAVMRRPTATAIPAVSEAAFSESS